MRRGKVVWRIGPDVDVFGGENECALSDFLQSDGPSRAVGAVIQAQALRIINGMHLDDDGATAPGRCQRCCRRETEHQDSGVARGSGDWSSVAAA